MRGYGKVNLESYVNTVVIVFSVCGRKCYCVSPCISLLHVT